LLISEVPEDNPKKLGIYRFEEYLVDAVIMLSYLGIGGEEFVNLQIRKMRGIKHERGILSVIVNCPLMGGAS